MEKESIYLLQKIDCNCNDCFFMKRDFETYERWEKWHREMKLAEFERKKNKAINEAKIQNNSVLLEKAEKMVFHFDKSGLIQYGKCQKFLKPVSFIPGICQLETQECFSHRKDHVNKQ
jgi:hypothetical protein